MAEPCFSIITSVYNRSATLQDCIDSVAEQTWPYKEHIVIDGGSNDESVKIIKKNKDKLSYWVTEPDKGIYQAWNKGLRVASGDWIIFLGADDLFHDEFVLESFVRYAGQSLHDISIAYGRVEQIGFDGVLPIEFGEPWDIAKKQIYSRMTVPNPGCFYRRSLFGTYGLYDESYKVAGDYDFFLRVVNDHEPYFIDELVVTRMKPGGISGDPLFTYQTLREGKRAQMHNNVYTFSIKYYVELMKFYIKSQILRMRCHSL